MLISDIPGDESEGEGDGLDDGLVLGKLDGQADQLLDQVWPFRDQTQPANFTEEVPAVVNLKSACETLLPCHTLAQW